MGTHCSVEYSYYKDVLITMSNTQKKQAALIPTNATSSDYEYQISALTSSGSILTFGAVNLWSTLPDLSSFDQKALLYSMEINVDESAPTGDTTCWVQFTLTVRKKSNHLDYASGVIKLVPTLSIVGPPPPPPGLWASPEGQYTYGIQSYVAVNNNGEAWTLKETFFNTDGTWQDVNNVNAGFNRSGRWLPAGANAANYSLRCRDVTTIIVGSQDVNITSVWQKANVRRYVRIECRIPRNNSPGTRETRWYGIIDVRNDLTGEIVYSGWLWTRAIVTLT
jgi:hypothetical protein